MTKILFLNNEKTYFFIQTSINIKKAGIEKDNKMTKNNI